MSSLAVRSATFAVIGAHDVNGMVPKPAEKSKYPIFICGGETGIRTLGGLAPTTVFETAPFDHSGTSPQPSFGTLP